MSIGSYDLSLDRELTSPASLNPNYDLSSIQERLRLNSSPGASRIGSEEPSTAITSLEAEKTFEFIRYEDVDSGQKIEFEKLLKKVYSFKLRWVHNTLRC